VLHIAKQWVSRHFTWLMKNLTPGDVLMVGDGAHDMLSGNAAGALTCLIKHDWNEDAREMADFVIDSLTEIEGIVKEFEAID
jgi:phosphoglycolate phosphatase-like HAD superfamily hydrolase